LATLVTPNLREAEVLTGRAVTTVREMREAARALVARGARAALVKGGHLAGDAVDVLHDGRGFLELRAPRREGRRLHGTGCVLGGRLGAHALELLAEDADADVGCGDVLLDPSRGARAEPDVDLVVDHHHPDGEPVRGLPGGDRP